MLIRKCPRSEIEAAAAEAGVRVTVLEYGLRGGWKVRLAPLHGRAPRYFRRGFKLRRLSHCLCWHGFAAFFEALYRHVPEASVRTVLAGYRSAENFAATYPETASRNIGSQRHPLQLADACDCALFTAPMACDVCEATEDVTYKRHGWDRVTRVCRDRHCRRAVQAVEMLRKQVAHV